MAKAICFYKGISLCNEEELKNTLFFFLSVHLYSFLLSFLKLEDDFSLKKPKRFTLFCASFKISENIKLVCLFRGEFYLCVFGF